MLDLEGLVLDLKILPRERAGGWFTRAGQRLTRATGDSIRAKEGVFKLGARPRGGLARPGGAGARPWDAPARPKEAPARPDTLLSWFRSAKITSHSMRT
ncbi:hypothetical protein J2Z83_001323 [Virgibacillus natechei]|uniref:Uncharacterized protein n=1 Tax=Virgibacillus natechei TaxID=1216297 RepID=A0ABS4IGT0_9BACI|nr:hypothetical protein [Virgibacillus natechei]